MPISFEVNKYISSIAAGLAVSSAYDSPFTGIVTYVAMTFGFDAFKSAMEEVANRREPSKPKNAPKAEQAQRPSNE